MTAVRTFQPLATVASAQGLDVSNYQGQFNWAAAKGLSFGINRVTQGLGAAGTSQYKGVSWKRRDRRWQAQIGTGVRGRVRFLGHFAVEEDAARAYDAAAQEMFGPFGRLNFEEDA